MSDHSPSNACPKCGAALPSAATSGLCPCCLMAEAMLPTQADAPATSANMLTPAELAPHFPQLEILECLGRGGMGVVYKARQKTLNRFVALKLLAPERVTDAKFAERFTHEAQALAALNHPSIVTIYDFGQAGGFYYLLMEFVDGVNLRQAMKAGRFTPEQALAVVPPVCEALQYAHEHGIVHRDIKPENLLLDKEGRVKIADFGIAKIIGRDADAPVHEGAQTGVSASLTAGTPQYMAPEQKAHRATDHRADIYSLGVVLYELLTGELPADKLQPPSRKVQIDVRLDEIVLRALEKSPELRYQTAGEFRTQVETIVSQPIGTAGAETGKPTAGDIPQREPRFSRTAIAGAGWVILGLLAFLWLKLFEGQHVGRWRDMTGPERLGFLFTEVLFISGFASTVGTTILGWISVTQIRRSAGKLYGLGLAVFDGLLFPLLALDAVIGWIWPAVIKMVMGRSFDTSAYLQIWNPDIAPTIVREWATVATVVTALIVDYFIILAVWRAVNRTTEKPRVSQPSLPNTPRSILACCVAYSSGLFAAAAWMLILSGQSAASWAWGILITALLGMALAIGVQRTSCGKHALWFGGIQTLVWIFFAAFSLLHDFRGIPDLARVDSTGVVQRSPFPKAATFTRNAGTVLWVHDNVDVHYVFFAPKAIGTTDSSSYNNHSLAWLDKGAFKLTEQWTFGYLRESTDPVHLKVNGKEYDLRQGRVFLPHDDGTLEQRPLEVSLTTAMDPDAMAKLTANPGIGERAMRDAKLSFGSVIEREVDGAIDFDSGKVANGFPESVTKPDDIAENVLKAVEWMEREGLDALTEPSRSLKGVGMKAKAVDEDAWDKLKPEQAITTLEMTKRETWQDLDPKRKTDEELKAPETWVFETREGGRGILQVLEHSERGVKIRYKLVQGVATTPATSTTAQRSVFGLRAERMITTRDANRDGVVAFRFENNLPFQPPVTLTGHFQKPETVGFTPELKQWMLNEKVDLLLHFGGKGYTLLSLDMRDGSAGQPTEWDFLSPQKAAPLLAGLEKLNSNPGPRVAGVSGYRDGLCDVRVFCTREGQVGFYQLRGLDDADGRGVMIRYKLVLTDQAKPASATSAAPPSFGPIIQCFIATGKTKQSFYSIERDAYVEAPARLPQIPRFEDQSAEAKAALEQYAKWLADNDVDFLVQPAQGNENALALADMLARPVLEEHFTDSVPKLMDAFKDNLAAGHPLPLTPLLLNIDSRLGTFFTTIFKTRKGRIGILQIVSVSDNPRGVNVRYKLVRNDQVKPAATTNDATPPAFGPVIERELAIPVENSLPPVWLDLDSGKEISTAEFTGDLDQPGAFPAWLKQQGADLASGRFATEETYREKDSSPPEKGTPFFQHGLYAWSGIGLNAMAVKPELWDSADATALLSMNATFAAMADSGFQKLIPEGQSPQNLNGKLPATFLFETAEGHMGLIQILDFTKEMRSVKMRYKLVRGDQAKPATIKNAAPLSFGRALERVVTDPHEFADAKSLLLDTADWEKMPAEELAVRMAGAEKIGIRANANSKPYVDLSVALPALIADGRPATPLPQSLIWAFKKPNGDTGILQVTGFTQNPRGVNIRIKVVQTAQAQPATTTNPAKPPAFGPLLERVLPSGEPCREQLFQFRSGEIFIVGNGPGTSPDEAAFDHKRIDDAGGVDMSAISGVEGIQIAGRGCFFTRDVQDLKWDRFTAEQAVEAVKNVSFVEGVVSPKKGEFPITYLFKTARGEVGIMEVLGTVEVKHGDWNEKGMRFRYKLVQGTGSTTNTPSKIALPILNFGKETQGMQAALAVTPGEPFGLRIYLRNVSDKAIALDGASYRQADECLLTDANGKSVPITRVTHDIKVGMGGGYHGPGQVAIFESAGLSFQSLDKVPSSAGYVAQAKPGRYTLRMKLRLPGDDVPFAPNQGVWHGELETGPVTIEVKDPATQKVAPVADAIFSSHLGKPVEITVNDLQWTRENCAISLDTGKLLPVPASITLDALPQNKRTKEPAPSVAEASVRKQEEALTWARSNQVDAVAFVTTKDGKVVKCGLLCPDLLVSRVENKAWTPDLADARMLKEDFEKAMHEWNFIPQIAEITSDGDFPATYLILDTRTHRRGVLQILGTSDQPRGVKISYRLIEGAEVKKITQAAQPAAANTSPDAHSAVFSEKTQRIVDALLQRVGHLVIALEHSPQEQPNRHSLLLCTEDRPSPDFYLRPRVADDQMKKLLLRLAADGYFDRAIGGLLPPKSSQSPPLPAKNQPGYLLQVFTPNHPDSTHYSFNEDLSQQEGAAYMAAMKLRLNLEGEALRAVDTILNEIAEQSALKITKEEAAQVEILLKKGPVTPDMLAAIFEHDETSGSSYRRRSDVVAIPILIAGNSKPDSNRLEALHQTVPLGEVLHQIGDTTFYVQWDELGSSTHHYYGPYHDFDEIAKVLGLKLKAGKSGAMKFGLEIERVVAMTQVIDLDTGKVMPFLSPDDGPTIITDNIEKDTSAWNAKLRKRGVDAIYVGGGQLWGLDLKLRLVPGGDITTPEQLAAVLNFDVNVPAPESVIRLGIPAPAVFAFQTREGGMGLLVNEGPVGANGGVKIIYKLVQGAPRGARPALNSKPASNPPTSSDREPSDRSELEGQKLVEVFRAPLELVKADIFSDGGTRGIVFKDAKARTLELCVDRQEETKTWGRLFVGAMHPTRPGAILTASGGKAEKMVLSLLRGWLKEHIPDKTQNELRVRDSAVGLSESEVKHLRVIQVLDTLANRNSDARLQFRLVTDEKDANAEALTRRGETSQVRVSREVLLDETSVSGASVLKVGPGPCISVRFNEAGSKKFKEITGAIVGKQLAIIFDGKLLAEPTITAAITDGSALITGSFTVGEAEALAKAMAEASRPKIPVPTASEIQGEAAESDTRRHPVTELFINNHKFGADNGCSSDVPLSGQSTCGHPGHVSDVTWKFLRTDSGGDVYEFSRKYPSDAAAAKTNSKEVTYAGKALTLWEDDTQKIILRPKP